MAVKIGRASSLEQIFATPEDARRKPSSKKYAQGNPYASKRASVDSIYKSLWQSSLYATNARDGLEEEEGKWWRLLRQYWLSRTSYHFIQSHTRPNYLLCCIPKQNPFRKKLKRVVNSRLFKSFIALVVVLNVLSLSFFEPYINGDQVEQNRIIAYVTVIFVVVYIVEMCLKVLVYGLLLLPGAYLRQPMNVLDMGIIAFGFVYLIYWSGYVGEILSAFMALKLIHILIHFEIVRYIIRALVNSISPLFYLGWLTLCVMVFFALLGMELFLPHRGLHYGCYVNYTDALDDEQLYRVSDYPCFPLESSTVHGGHVCDQLPNRSRCEDWPVGPNNGIGGFDDFGVAIFTVFQCMTLEGWTSILYLYESRFGTTYVWLYFCTLIILGSTIVLNLLLGVLTSVFLGVSDRQEAQGSIRKRKARLQVEEDLNNYHDWMQRSMQEDRRRRASTTGSYFSEIVEDLGGDDSDYEESNDELVRSQALLPPWLKCALRGLKMTRIWARKVVKSHAFFVTMMAIIVLNLVTLSFSVHPPWVDDFVRIMNTSCTVVYILEFILKLFGLGPRQYFSSLFNRLDFLCVLLNLVDLLVLLPLSASFPLSEIVNTLRALRLVLILKYTRHWQELKDLMQALSELTLTILSLIGLVGAALIFFSLLGMRIFGTRLSVGGHHHPNYNGFVESLLLVFQLFTTENWDRVLERTASSYGYYSERVPELARRFITSYYVVVVVIVGLILSSIFLAVSVDKLSELKEVKRDMSMRTEQQQEMRKERRKQLHDLKNADNFSSTSSTLYRLVKFYSLLHNQQSRQLKRQNPKGQRAHSLQLGKAVAEEKRESLRKTVSTPEGNLTSLNLNDAEAGKATLSAGPTSAAAVDPSARWHPHVVKTAMKNPLARFQNSFDEVEKLHTSLKRNLSTKSNTSSPLRLSMPSSSLSVDAVGSSVMSAQDSSTSLESSVFAWKADDSPVLARADFDSGSRELFRDIGRHPSVQSEPLPSLARVSSLNQEPLDYMRSQSLPLCESPEAKALDDDGMASSKVTFTTGSMEEDEEDNEERSEREQSQERSMASPHLSLVGKPNDTKSSARFERQSSLELIQPMSMMVGDQEERRRERRPWRMGGSWAKVKAKGGKIVDWLKEYLGTLQLDPREELQEIPNHSAFFILSPDNRLRVFCYGLVTSHAFQTISFAVLLFGSLILALELPVPIESDILCPLQQIPIFIDFLLLMWFLLEMVIKMAALGVFLHKGSYFRSVFNMCDFFVTVVTAVPVMYYLSNTNPLLPCLSYVYVVITPNTVIRVCRVLRPVRAIRIQGLYRVVRGLVTSIKYMVYVFFVASIVLFIFAIIGVLLFKGKFYYCTDLVVVNEDECRGQYFTYPTGDLDCPEVFNRTWQTQPLHFDNLAVSLLTLYAMLTKEGWDRVMYAAVDLNGVNTGPVEGASPWTSIYFLLYMGLVSIFLLNLFVGFVIVTFQTFGVRERKEDSLDRNQMNCLYFALTVCPQKNFVPSTKCHAMLYRMVRCQMVSFIMSGVVVVNCIFLALQSENMENDFRMIIYYVNVGFTSLFVIEAIVKISILTPPIYFRDFVSWFEFLVMLGSLIELLIQIIFLADDHPLRYSHMVSALRVLRLLYPNKNTQLILWTVVKSLEIFPWVGVLLIVVLYLNALIGMQMFGNIRVASIDESETTAIHQYNNFANFPQAFLVMIRCFTGENWQEIMLSCVGAECDDSVANQTMCGSDFSYVFFPLFFFVSTILILNLFVAIIIDNFDYYVRDKSILGSHHLRRFPKLWSRFNTTKTELLHHSSVMGLMRSIDPPLGWGKLCPQKLAQRRMMQLNIPMTTEGYVSIDATLFSIVVWSHLDAAKNFRTNNISREKKVQRLRELFPRVPKKRIENVIPMTSCINNTGCYYATLIIQDHWRQYKLVDCRRTRLFGQMTLRRVPDMSQALLNRRISVYHQRVTVNWQEDEDSHDSDPSLPSPSNGSGIHGVPPASSGTHSASPVGTSSLLASPASPASVDKKPPLAHRNSSFLVRLPTIDEHSDPSDQEQVSPCPEFSTFPSRTEASAATEEADMKEKESVEARIILGAPPLSVDRMSIQSDDSMYSTPRGSLSSLNSATGTLMLETSV